MQIQELQTNHNKEIETYNNEFVILKKQIEEKFTVFKQQNSPKVEERNNTIMDVNTSKIGKLETKINELNDKISNLTIAYVKTITTQSSQISIKHEKEIETLKKEFQEKMEKEISDLNSKFSVLFSENKKSGEENKINNEKLNEQNEFRIKQLETKIKELVDNGKTSEHAINYFKSMSILINDMQINHNKEIGDLKKEFRESISSINSKIYEEENKINDEEIDEFMKNYVLHNPNPTEEEKLRISARILCVSIDKIDGWLENHHKLTKDHKIKENECNSSSEIINDFDIIDYVKGSNGNEENDEEIEKEGEE
uniref:Homeobox domain-containing protein n=1 Tax=Meloidogyne hapla TaxID=6305 RepID=A0A1I8BCT5_MELHA